MKVRQTENEQVQYLLLVGERPFVPRRKGHLERFALARYKKIFLGPRSPLSEEEHCPSLMLFPRTIDDPAHGTIRLSRLLTVAKVNGQAEKYHQAQVCCQSKARVTVKSNAVIVKNVGLG